MINSETRVTPHQLETHYLQTYIHGSDQSFPYEAYKKLFTREFMTQHNLHDFELNIEERRLSFALPYARPAEVFETPDVIRMIHQMQHDNTWFNQKIAFIAQGGFLLCFIGKILSQYQSDSILAPSISTIGAGMMTYSLFAEKDKAETIFEVTARAYIPEDGVYIPEAEVTIPLQ